MKKWRCRIWGFHSGDYEECSLLPLAHAGSWRWRRYVPPKRRLYKIYTAPHPRRRYSSNEKEIKHGGGFLSFGSESSRPLRRSVRINYTKLWSCFLSAWIWNLSLTWVEHKLFQKKVLRRIFRSKIEEETRGWRKVHNRKFCNLNSSPRITRDIKSKRMGLTGYAVCTDRWDMSRNVWNEEKIWEISTYMEA
jgi:hypothetical protein